MSKLIITLQSIDYIDDYENNKHIKRYIVGNNTFGNRMPSNFSVDDIKKLKKISNKEVYVAINKLFHENEIDDLENYIKELTNSDIDGIVFSDFAVYEIIKELKWNVKLSYSTDTTITSSSFTTLCKEMEIDELELAKEITLKEIKDISSKKNVPVIAFIHGHIYMYNSFRKLITNYKTEANIELNVSKDELFLYDDERDVYYPIIENEKGTNILSSNDQHSFTEMYELLNSNVDYFKIDCYGYIEEDINKIINNYSKILDVYNDSTNKVELEEELKKIAKSFIEEMKNEIKNKEFNNGFLKKKRFIKKMLLYS